MDEYILTTMSSEELRTFPNYQNDSQYDSAKILYTKLFEDVGADPDKHVLWGW